MIEATIIEDSLVRTTGARLTTFKFTYPRFVHSELMTHRLFSRNAASSRAIPFKKFLEQIEETPAIPIHWGSNQPGMQAGQQIPEREEAERIWLRARDAAIGYAKELHTLGLHKQIVNRLLEPWFHIAVLVSTTDVDNFFSLRSHGDAEPHIAALSDAALKAYEGNEPRILEPGDWHLPFSRQHMQDDWTIDDKRIVAVARAARVSYLNFDGAVSLEDDKTLFNRLMSGGHWSPFEHVAVALDDKVRSGNFEGFRQYRKMFATELRSLGKSGRRNLLAERMKLNPFLSDVQ